MCFLSFAAGKTVLKRLRQMYLFYKVSFLYPVSWSPPIVSRFCLSIRPRARVTGSLLVPFSEIDSVRLWLAFRAWFVPFHPHLGSIFIWHTYGRGGGKAMYGDAQVGFRRRTRIINGNICHSLAIYSGRQSSLH